MEEKKLNDAEIIKALEHCLNGDYKTKCNVCHYDKSKGYCQDMDRDALDLIKRLQSENEILQKENERLKKFELYRIKKTKEQEVEIERLTKDKSFATRKMMESKAKAVELQKQVDELTKERETANKHDLMYWFKAYSECAEDCASYVCENGTLQAKNSELQKQVDKYKEKWQTSYMNELELQSQVDELKEENNRYAEVFGMVGKYFYTVEVGEWEKVKSGVKDMIQQSVKNTAKEIFQGLESMANNGVYQGKLTVQQMSVFFKEQYGIGVEE